MKALSLPNDDLFALKPQVYAGGHRPQGTANIPWRPFFPLRGACWRQTHRVVQGWNSPHPAVSPHSSSRVGFLSDLCFGTSSGNCLWFGCIWPQGGPLLSLWPLGPLLPALVFPPLPEVHPALDVSISLPSLGPCVRVPTPIVVPVVVVMPVLVAMPVFVVPSLRRFSPRLWRSLAPGWYWSVMSACGPSNGDRFEPKLIRVVSDFPVRLFLPLFSSLWCSITILFSGTWPRSSIFSVWRPTASWFQASPRFDSSSFLSSPRSGLSLWPNWLFVFFFFFSDFSPLRRFFFSFFGTLAFLSVLPSVFSVFGTSCSASFGSFFDSFFASFFAPSFKGDAPNSASSLPSGELRPKGPLSPVSTKSLKAPAAFRRIASTAVSWKPLRRPPRSSLPTLK